MWSRLSHTGAVNCSTFCECSNCCNPFADDAQRPPDESESDEESDDDEPGDDQENEASDEE